MVDTKRRPFSTSDAIHPELRRMARFLPSRPLTARSLPVVRRLAANLVRLARSDAEICRIGEITVRVHRPPADMTDPGPAILWMHGGGFVMGTAAQDDAICRRFAQRHGATVVAVDYRLAPEHRFPVPLEDCHDALMWLAERPEVDPERIVIAGASAGGGLTAGLALMARERGMVHPVLQVLVYPMIDDRTALWDDLDNPDQRLWTNASNRFGWHSYTGLEPGASDVSTMAAPAREEDLTGLPAAWMGVGTLDLFLDENVTYAERLREAGVECVLDVVDGAFHGFDALAPKTEVVRRFRDSQDVAIERAVST